MSCANLSERKQQKAECAAPLESLPQPSRIARHGSQAYHAGNMGNNFRRRRNCASGGKTLVAYRERFAAVNRFKQDPGAHQGRLAANIPALAGLSSVSPSFSSPFWPM